MRPSDLSPMVDNNMLVGDFDYGAGNDDLFHGQVLGSSGFGSCSRLKISRGRRQNRLHRNSNHRRIRRLQLRLPWARCRDLQRRELRSGGSIAVQLHSTLRGRSHAVGLRWIQKDSPV